MPNPFVLFSPIVFFGLCSPKTILRLSHGGACASHVNPMYYKLFGRTTIKLTLQGKSRLIL